MFFLLSLAISIRVSSALRHAVTAQLLLGVLFLCVWDSTGRLRGIVVVCYANGSAVIHFPEYLLLVPGHLSNVVNDPALESRQLWAGAFYVSSPSKFRKERKAPARKRATFLIAFICANVNDVY
jgi:hypothetical protein